MVCIMEFYGNDTYSWGNGWEMVRKWLRKGFSTGWEMIRELVGKELANGGEMVE